MKQQHHVIMYMPHRSVALRYRALVCDDLFTSPPSRAYHSLLDNTLFPSRRLIIVTCRRAPQNALQCQGERDACIKCYSGATGPDGVLACVDVVDAFNKCAVATTRKGSKKE